MTSVERGQKLTTRQVAKPWGRAILPAPFGGAQPERIGEIWFEAAQGPALPLMVKYLFTSEKLSVQVHPSDAQARAMGLASGKEECWLVLDAEPGAVLGIGTHRPLSPEELREAAVSGEIEALMDWKPVQRGDFFYIPAGTIHAIGAGISLIEVQQNADITYRLYDYGRPRALHLDEGVAVSRAEPYSHRLQQRVDLQGEHRLVEGPFFSLLLTGDASARLDGSGPLMVIPLQGSAGVELDSASITVEAGECLAIDSDSRLRASEDARLLLARAN